jgi:hypothetical protein
MSKRRIIQALKIVIFTLAAPPAVLFVILFSVLSFYEDPPSEDTMRRVYEGNEEDLLQIVDMFTTLDFNSAAIWVTDEDYRFIGIHDVLPVERYAYNDDKTYAAFKRLFDERGCLAIVMKKNYIGFSWRSIGAYCGIVYSLDGGAPRMYEEFGEERTLELSPLGQRDWYYYYCRPPDD